MLNYFKKLKSLIFLSEINKKIFTQSFWVLLGNVVSKFTLLIATIFMAKYLGKTEYGQFGIIKSTILMFTMFAGIELGITATKYISQYRFKDKLKVKKIVGLSNFLAIIISLIISISVYVFSKEIAIKINAESLSEDIRISSFILFFSSLNGIQNGILAGLEKFKILSINNAIAGILSSLGLILASKYYNLNIVVIAFGLNYIFLFLLNFISLRPFYREYKVNIFRKSNFEEINVILSFSLPAILAGCMVGPIIWFVNYILVNQPSGYEQMADFDIANQWRTTVLFIPTALSQIILPMLSSKVDNKEEYKTVFNKNLKINLFIGVSLSLFFIFITPLIIMFYGDKYENAKLPMIIMFLTTALITVNNVFGQGMASKGKMWLGFYVNALWGVVLVISSLILVKYLQMGAFGLSLAYLISYFSHTLVQFLYIRKFI